LALAFWIAPTGSLLALQTSKAAGRKPRPAPAKAENWLTDADGRQYKIDKLPKSQPHTKLEDGRLRTVWGFTVDLAGEDATHYWVKIYRATDTATKAPTAAATAAAKAAVAKSYQFTLKVSNRVRLEPFNRGLPTSGQWRNGFVLADINKDGHIDIVHGPARKRPGPPVVFLGDGKGAWRRWSEARFPPGPYDYGDVAVADFNTDGHLDIAMGMHLTGITAMLNDGQGHFRAASAGMDPIGSGRSAFSSRAILAADWSGDGAVDLLALGEGPSMNVSPGLDLKSASSSQGVRIYRNRGAGSWEKQDNVAGSTVFGDSLAVVRLSDGRKALVTGSNSIGSKNVLFVSESSGSVVVRDLDGLRPAAMVKAVTVADFDGDGVEDLALGYSSFEGAEWRSGVDLLLQGPGGAWTRRTLFAERGAHGIGSLAAGDLNGDGLPDLAAGTGTGRLMVLVNSGKGVFTREGARLSTEAAACRVYRVGMADLDGDGRSDLVASFAGEEEGMLTFKNSGCPGEGSLRAWRSVPLAAARP
jgi:hypothetical protein